MRDVEPLLEIPLEPGFPVGIAEINLLPALALALGEDAVAVLGDSPGSSQ